MSFYRGPKIVTNGLVFMVDPINTKSYQVNTSNVYSLISNYNGNFVNEPLYDNGGFLLDGTNDYINFGNILNVNQFPDGITLTSWVKTTANQNYATIIGKAFYGGKVGRYSLHSAPDGKVGILFQYSTITITLVAPTVINDGTWHYVSTTVGSSGSRIYIDGVKVSQDNRSALPSELIRQLTISR